MKGFLLLLTAFFTSNFKERRDLALENFVLMHDGSVTAESEGEGKGATFTVKLPVRALYTAETERALMANAQTRS